MRSAKQAILKGFWFAACCIVLTIGVLPQSAIPERLTPFAIARGRFAGKPVRLVPRRQGKSNIPMRVKIQMDQGICLVSLGHDEEQELLFSMGEGSVRGQIPRDEELVLDPQGDEGFYDVAIGPEWHPLAPRARRIVFLPMAIGMTVALIFSRRLKPKAIHLPPRQSLFLAATGLLSGLVLYPAVHEAGHMVFGMLSGATPNWHGVVWTVMSGVEPHAAFYDVPKSAAPFMSAGGPILPTGVALLLLLIWRLIYRKTSWYVSAALVLIPVLFLFSTVGCLFELYRGSHMDALSVHWRLTGIARVLVSLSPFLVAVAVYVWLGIKLRGFGTRRRPSIDLKGASEEMDMKPRAAAIIKDRGRILLIHRIKEGREYWVLPGGSIEAGESEMDACHREVREETGLSIRILGLLVRIENRGRTETYFRAIPTGGKLELGEPERSRQSSTNRYGLEWVDQGKFREINFQPKQMKERIAELLASDNT